MNQEITQIKKVLFQAVSTSWNETEIFWQESHKIPNSETWANIYLLSLVKTADRGSYRRFEGSFTFSIFSTNFDNIYALDLLIDSFLSMFQDTLISSAPVAIKIGNAEIICLEDKIDHGKIEKNVTYRVITLDFYADITE